MASDGAAAEVKPVYTSGKVASNISQNVHLGLTGAPFSVKPDTLYTWSVRYYDSTDSVSPWAQNATFSTAPKTWTARECEKLRASCLAKYMLFLHVVFSFQHNCDSFFFLLFISSTQ